MRKRVLCCCPVYVRPSVCPSDCQYVTLVYCIQTAEDIVKLLSRPIILDFLIPSADTQFQGDPFSRGGKYTEGGEICNFRLKSPFISETVRDRSIVAMDFNSKS